MTTTELSLLIILSCLWMAFICHYFRVSRLEREIESLKLRNVHIQRDLFDLTKNVEKLVDKLLKIYGTTRDH